MVDKIKIFAAVLLVAAAVGGFYYFADESFLLRVLALIVAAGVSLVIAAQTAVGRQTLAFFTDAQIEVRKVVWPTGKETFQTTLIVLAMVILVALFLWILDAVLLMLVELATG